ncbi:MAG: DoxX family membrane protein [Actinobacteria bacterium]|nr:DoxX family membrane protein [Actinomycetota bacterium]
MGLLAARMVLGVVFGLAGAAKLMDRVGGRRALVDFGIPPRFAAPGAVLVPVAELGVAAALLARPWARLGAVGALVLLVVFSVALAVNLAAGRKTDCHCFGRLHSSPIGSATLLRNGVLAGLSILVMVKGPGLELADGLALAAVAVIVGLVVRMVAANHRHVHPAPEATDAPSLSRRRALALLVMTVVGAALNLRLPLATACGAECRSSDDCPGTCRNCRKQAGFELGHCH